MTSTRASLKLQDFIEQLRKLHRHVCPRQVLGLRMGMHAAEWFSLDLPQADKRLIAFVETDGCFADGVTIATGCTLGHRTMRLMDYGKVAVTVVDTETERALRMAPKADVRQRASVMVPDAPNRWRAQLEAYQVLPTEDLLVAQEVEIKLDLREIIGKPGVRVNCAACGEEILNLREIVTGGQTLCRSCASDSYWRPIQSE